MKETMTGYRRRLLDDRNDGEQCDGGARPWRLGRRVELGEGDHGPRGEQRQNGRRCNEGTYPAEWQTLTAASSAIKSFEASSHACRPYPVRSSWKCTRFVISSPWPRS